MADKQVIKEDKTPIMERGRLITKQELATYLNADTRTVQRLIARRKLSSMKIGRLIRFDPAKLTKELARLERPSQVMV